MPNFKEYLHDQTLLTKLMNWDTERAVGFEKHHPWSVYEKALNSQANLIPEEASLLEDMMRVKQVLKSKSVDDFINMKQKNKIADLKEKLASVTEELCVSIETIQRMKASNFKQLADLEKAKVDM